MTQRTAIDAALRASMFTARLAAGITVLRRLMRAARTADPIRAAVAPTEPISVVVPARDEAERIAPLLERVVAAPGVVEVIVVDDESTDGTDAVARAAGATVVDGMPLPHGWAGKAWALQQGIEAARSEWVVTLDADTRADPRLPAALVARARQDDLDLLTVGGRFDCPTPGARWLHASLLTTLVYRFGPPGSAVSEPGRTMANGQCMVFRRDRFASAGGMKLVAGEVVEDVALARRLGERGWSVAFLDATDLLTVRMFESLRDTWIGWGRSIALPGVQPLRRQLLDLATLLLAQALPLPRLLLRRGDLLDIALLAARVGTLVGTRRAYDRADLAYWLSPLADPASMVAIGRGILRGGRQTWRGRAYR